MHPSVLLLLLTVAAAAGGVHVRARHAEGTPAAKFWEQALPGSPMPESIAELVQKGIDHTPLLAHNNSDPYIGQGKWSCTITLKYGCNGAAAAGVFFRMEEARVGSTMTAYLPAAGALPGILPRDAAARAPFGDSAAVLARFGITPGSDTAAGVEDTLRWCREPPLRGERKACANSLEATVGAATRLLATTGAGRRAVWAAASALPRDGLPRQSYAVAAVAPLDGDRHVACHDVPFPYAFYQCHVTRPSSSRAFMVTLRDVNRGGPEATVAAVCHLDTSGWNPEHPAFKILHTKPGGVPVCHFMPYAHLVFGEKAAAQP